MRPMTAGRVARRLREFYGTDEDDVLQVAPEEFARVFGLEEEHDYLAEYFDWTDPFQLAQSIICYLPRTRKTILAVLDLRPPLELHHHHQIRRKIRVLRPFSREEFEAVLDYMGWSEWEVLFSPELSSKDLQAFLDRFLNLCGREQTEGISRIELERLTKGSFDTSGGKKWERLQEQ